MRLPMMMLFLKYLLITVKSILIGVIVLMFKLLNNDF